MLTSLRELFTGRREDEVAKATKIDQKRIKAHVQRLNAAGTERAAFDRVVADLKADEDVSSAELRAIAHGYVGGGKIPANKKLALAALSTRFAELVRSQKNRATAEKVRPL